MDLLAEARLKIDAIDAEMAALFEARMQAVLDVVAYKKENDMPIYDAAREETVRAKNVARIQCEALKPYYADVLQYQMDVTKQYEAAVLGQNSVAYQGVEGAFAHIALTTLFPHANAVSYPTWDAVFDAVENGEASYGVLPFENSHAGDVGAVLDLCFKHTLSVVRQFDLPVNQNLLGVHGANIGSITDVYSHPQAIAQSEKFLKTLGLRAHAMENTAMAAKFVAQSGDATKAAIASDETAALYSLDVLAPSINTDGDNTTRFIVVAKEAALTGNRFSLLFTVDNKPGKLSQVIQGIAQTGLNMVSIKSRPMPHVPFEYYFYAELVGTPAQAGEVLDVLSSICHTARLLGVTGNQTEDTP